MSFAKQWCFTLKNYDQDDIDVIKTLSADKVRYVCFQKEIGVSGTPHLQGFVVFHKQRRLTAVKKIVSDRARFEVCIGVSAAQNREYCSKEGGEFFYESGTIPASKAGKRSDLDDFKEAVKGGELSLTRLREDFSDICAKYPRYVREYLDDNVPRPLSLKKQVEHSDKRIQFYEATRKSESKLLSRLLQTSDDWAVADLKYIAKSLNTRLDALKTQFQAGGPPSTALQLAQRFLIEKADPSKEALLLIIKTIDSELSKVENTVASLSTSHATVIPEAITSLDDNPENASRKRARVSISPA
jgi:hypothetical protein